MGRTLLLIKPDAVERNLIGEIIWRLEKARFIVAAMKMVKLDFDEARKFYAVHEGKPFLDELCRFMSSGPIVDRRHQSGEGRGRDSPPRSGGKPDKELGSRIRFSSECRAGNRFFL
jgi:hypothetical protein